MGGGHPRCSGHRRIGESRVQRRAPPVIAETTAHTGRGPRRCTAARVAAPMAATASAKASPVASMGPSPGSRAWAQRVKCARMTSAARAKARSHPRTMSSETPSDSAMRRWPLPPALASTAPPMVSASSRRRRSIESANSTCVDLHERHLVRRGRTGSSPALRRSTRRRAWAHGPSTPPHRGQPKRPARRSASTSAWSVPTMSTGASGICQEEPSRQSGQDRREGSCASTSRSALRADQRARTRSVPRHRPRHQRRRHPRGS